MGQLNYSNLQTWQVNRILSFLNSARDASDITDSPLLLDDPNSGQGSSTIGATVAQRILDARNVLPGRRFTSLSQLEGISGFGQDKLDDLIYSFGIPAAEAFKNLMYRDVIGTNWELNYHRFEISDRQTFLDTVNNDEEFTKFVRREIVQLADAYSTDPDIKQKARQELRQSLLQNYPASYLSPYVFGTWFYAVDADNWFGFDQVYNASVSYLDFLAIGGQQSELRMFRGFDNAGLLVNAISSEDLPVVANFNEQAIVIWTVQLND